MGLLAKATATTSESVSKILGQLIGFRLINPFEQITNDIAQRTQHSQKMRTATIFPFWQTARQLTSKAYTLRHQVAIPTTSKRPS